MVGGDRLVDRQVVDLDVAGSNPVAHPILVPRSKWTRHRPVTPEEASSSLVGIAILMRGGRVVEVTRLITLREKSPHQFESGSRYHIS